MSLPRLALLSLALALTACGSSVPGNQSQSGPNSGSGTARAGVSTDYDIPSDVDGANISFTVHEPTQFVEGAKYPLILEGHGYGGSKTAASARPAAGSAGTFGRLLDAGYGIISISQRGFGDSGGTVRLLDPDFEGKDLIQILDWAEASLPWLAYRNNNLLLGAIGGSYGGGYQHTVLANDPKRRLDAIAPEITWHDLRFALYSSGVFKSFWATVLSGAGTATGNQDPEIQEGLAQGLGTNSLDDEKTALLKKVSMAGYCENGQVPPVDALYWQSSGDTLFNLNETLHNVQCVAAQGGDVRWLVKNSGHDSLVGGSSGEACGALDKTQSIVDWYDEKLKGVAGKASYIPRYCFNMNNGSGDGVVLPALPQAGVSVEIPEQTLVAQEGSPQKLSILLATAGPGGMVVAGIPRVTLTIADPLGLEAGDPIVFMILAKRAAGGTTDTDLQPNQVRPFRGYHENLEDELIGVSNRLAEGEELRLVISASNTLRYVKSGSVLATPVSISGSISLPIYPGNLPAPPDNTP